jgi:hypothetical protein
MKYMKRTLIIFVAMFCCISQPGVYAQDYYGIKISQNATSLPLVGVFKLFTLPLHPGITGVWNCRLNKNDKHQFRNEVNAGIFNHHLFQLGFQVTDIIMYNLTISKRLSAYTGMGGGYMHSFYKYDIFKLGEDGEYVHINSWKGRPQFTGVFVLGTGMGIKKSDPGKIRISLEMRSFVHGTFANSYVPIVPYNSLLLGVGFRINKQPDHNSPSK